MTNSQEKYWISNQADLVTYNSGQAVRMLPDKKHIIGETHGDGKFDRETAPWPNVKRMREGIKNIDDASVVTAYNQNKKPADASLEEEMGDLTAGKDLALEDYNAYSITKLTIANQILRASQTIMNDMLRKASELRVRGEEEKSADEDSSIIITDLAAFLGDSEDFLKTSEDAPRGLEDTPRGLEDTPKDLEDTPRGLEDTPRGLEDTPRGLEDTPRDLEDTPRDLEDTPRGTEDVPKGLLDNSQDSEDPKDILGDSYYLDNLREALRIMLNYRNIGLSLISKKDLNKRETLYYLVGAAVNDHLEAIKNLGQLVGRKKKLYRLSDQEIYAIEDLLAHVVSKLYALIETDDKRGFFAKMVSKHPLVKMNDGHKMNEKEKDQVQALNEGNPFREAAMVRRINAASAPLFVQIGKAHVDRVKAQVGNAEGYQDGDDFKTKTTYQP